MDIVIRRTLKKDLRSLKKIAGKTIDINYRPFLPKIAVDACINSGAEIERGWKRGVTALADGKIRGYAIMRENLIHAIMIDPDHQQGGLGTALIRHCEKILFHRHGEITLTCFEENRNACKFYKKNNWQTREVFRDIDTGLNRVLFHKQKHGTGSLPTGLAALGWDLKDENRDIARVTGVRRNLFLVSDGHQETLAEISGRLHHQAGEHDLFPATGDWVILKDGRIDGVLPRRNTLARGAAGSQGKKESAAVHTQVIAANLDTVFIVCGLDRDFNLRRIERYLTLVYNCGCAPVVILSKSDLHGTPEPFVREVETVSFGVPIHPVSAVEKSGTEALLPYLTPGKTVALLGSSGAGKSTLLNLLAGEEIQATRAVSRHGGKGVHTTTTRDLIRLPQGGLLIDNPGIREIAFWDVAEEATSTFPEIEAWAASCRFADCTHTEEPGCRVKEACENGELTQERLDSYMKQMRELDYLALRKHKSADRVEKERWKWVAEKVKAMKKSGKMHK